MELRVCSVHRREMTVLVRGRETSATVSGKVFLERPPAAGDIAVVEMEEGKPHVVEILPRRNSLQRPVLSGMQVIAANIDLAMVLVSLRDPPLRRGFVERSAASATWSGLQVMVLVNKVDLAAEDDREMLARLELDCGRAGFAFGLASCVTGTGLDAVRSAVSGRSVVMTGPSGAGKTTLIRILSGRDDLKTGPLSGRTGKGMHTTVGARVMPMACGGFLIDTPGLKVLPVSHIPRGEMKNCFPDIAVLGTACRFRDCLHSGEPGCAVKAAVEEGSLSGERYAAYRSLLEEVSRG
ncbi:ribosome small subunit-dependent GTPase A [Candidatus Fermentibacteria bacterium]|nr:ribosome small subunit-dependent GTPase A [Candidatus Fermentibacteria bacterium]